MRRRNLLLSTLVGVMPFVLVACSDQTPPDPRTDAPLVRVTTIQSATATSRAFTGIVAARVQSDLGFRVSGKVLQRLVDTGQTVKRGQVLLRLDPIDLQLAAHAQREAVAAARARAQQASDDEARYRALRSTGAVSASAYDQYKAAADSARAQLSAAEAQAKVAGNATRYAELLADADGIVMETLAEPGQVVSAGQSVVRLAHAGPREALVQLPETLRPAIGSSAQARLFGRQDVSVTTQLRQLSDVADLQTRTFEARYVLEGELADAPLGTTITVQISNLQTASPSAVQVPIAALYDAGNGPGIWMIRGEPAQVAWTPVSVQTLDDENARISGAIKAGDRIVALGAHLLRDGQAVRLAEPATVAATEEGQP
ncbi:efflux RND transporter periplasmic adaptor subunit [Pseudomonas putida]|uniref:efflux RND transporter periplasmic adaptor subunit n=1 Tax=Pseudomonas TaxID=286 RepID=UPI00159DE309|nr:efflux RND transporter periplasmic adaptor subunit [Pseudomonas putida]NVN61837.1 efflux RND transporter periplasmic adaptor subunit [Pseudomonas putida]NVN66830.1 efflux RND transporter periplasmic adaptor subunit [Pseudomonas putida]